MNDTIASEWGPRIVDFLAEVAREVRKVEAPEVTVHGEHAATAAELAGAIAPPPAVRSRGLPPLWAVGALVFVVVAARWSGWGSAPTRSALLRSRGPRYRMFRCSGIHSPLTSIQSAIVWQIRAPRVALGRARRGDARGRRVRPTRAPSATRSPTRTCSASPQGAGLGATIVIAFAPGGRRRRAAAAGRVRRRGRRRRGRLCSAVGRSAGAAPAR